jgi:hypothetical protein
MSRFAGHLERVAQICIAAVTVGFLGSALVYLYLGCWTVTMQDYWIIYETCLNRPWLEAAITRVNHHSLFFPSLIWLADLRFFRGDQQLLFFAGMLLLFCTAALLLVPLWRDKTINLTAKLAGTLVVIVGNFWMGRASITTSGGFLCICSLTIGGALLAFLWLPAMRRESPRLVKTCFIVLAFGFVASFSFGTGLAVWPTLLLLGWCLRLPPRSLLMLLGGGLIASVIYACLPGASGHASSGTLPLLMACGKGLQHLCMLLGAPFLYAEAAWRALPISTELAQSSFLSLSCGALGLVLAGLAIVPRIVRRDLARSQLELAALGLVIFNLVVMVIIIVGRTAYFVTHPSQVSGPRYLFWSSLFWTGLLLVAVRRAQSKEWLRWPVFLLAFAVPIGAFPLHYKEGQHWRYANYLAESGATSLINGVRDEQQIKVLFRDPKQVYRMAPQLRARRLDMFADGLQDWIGQHETSLFAGHHKSERFKGKCHVVGLLRCEDGAPAAKVTGSSFKQGVETPKTLVFIDPAGVVQGVARSWTMNKHIGRTFYSGKFINSEFVGYIRNYDPLVEYAVRSADDGTLSDEKIIVDPSTTTLQRP